MSTIKIISSFRDLWQTDPVLDNWLKSRYLTFEYNPYDVYPQAVIRFADEDIKALTNNGAAVKHLELTLELSDVSCDALIPKLNRIEQLYDWAKWDYQNEKISVCVRFQDSDIDYQDNIWFARLRFLLIIRNQ